MRIASPTVAAGLTPNPWKNLAAIYPLYVGASAAPILATSATTVPVMKIMRRPMMSAKEDQKRGPRARPRAGMATVQLTSSAVRLYWDWRAGKEGTVVVVM